MSVLATDNFNRANEAPMTNWVDYISPRDGFIIDSNVASVPSLESETCSAYDGGISWPSDQYSQAKITVAGTGDGAGFGVCVRATLGTLGEEYVYRVAVCKAASNNINLVKFYPSTFLNLGYRTTTWVDGDVVRLEVTGTGPNTLKIFQNGVQLGADFTDSSAPYPVSGRPGIYMSSTPISGNCDDWEGGDLVTKRWILGIH